MRVLRQRHARVADGVRPSLDTVRVDDRRIKELPDTELVDRLREARIEPSGVEPKPIDLRRVRAELRAPFDPGHVTDQEPAVVVLQPQPAAVMILVARGSVEERRDLVGELVHALADFTYIDESVLGG